MNYIAALTLMKKIILLQFLSDCDMKMRPSKAKVLIWKFFPITHSIIYYNQKAKKSFLRRKSYWGSWNSWESSVIGSSKVFLLKTDVLFYIIFSKRRSHLTISLTCFNKFQQNMEEYCTCMIETQNITWKIYVINFPIYK